MICNPEGRVGRLDVVVRIVDRVQKKFRRYYKTLIVPITRSQQLFYTHLGNNTCLGKYSRVRAAACYISRQRTVLFRLYRGLVGSSYTRPIATATISGLPPSSRL